MLEALLAGQARIEASQERVEAHLSSIAVAMAARAASSTAYRSQDSDGLGGMEAAASVQPAARGAKRGRASLEAPERAEPEQRDSAMCVSESGCDEDPFAEVAPMLPKRWPRALKARRPRGSCSEELSGSMFKVLTFASSRKTVVPRVQRVTSAQVLGRRCWAGCRRPKQLRARMRVFGDVCGLVFLLYDLTVVPYTLAWNTLVTTTLAVAMLVTWCFPSSPRPSGVGTSHRRQVRLPGYICARGSGWTAPLLSRIG